MRALKTIAESSAATTDDLRRIQRRQFVGLAGLPALGLSSTALLHAEEINPSVGAGTSTRPKSCIMIFLYGGPSHLDLWDLKPNAPVEIRGEFSPIETSVSGTFVCEHLPRLARLAHHYSIVRSLRHNNRNHSPASGWMLTGVNPNSTDDPRKVPTVSDPPALGSVAAGLSPPTVGMPAFVQLPARLYFDPGLFFLGQAAGWMGSRYDPVLIQQDPSSPAFRLEEFTQRPETPQSRLIERGRLLEKFRGQADSSSRVHGLLEYQQRALELLTSPSGTTAFDLGVEPPSVRERYGMNMLGQSCLLARRLVESGVRLITVADSAPNGLHQWDTHQANFRTLKSSLLPRLDQATSALLEDLHIRGLLQDTVVYIGGEFGRTPRIGEKSAGGAEPDGRDHWCDCYSGVLASGLIRSGITFGSSDPSGAYPTDSPVSPDDMGATILSAMGLNSAAVLRTLDGRPFVASPGTPVRGLLS